MKNCPVCGREFPDNVKFCPNDGQTLRAKSPAADLVGQVVADRYHIVKKLGEGGMGAVYLGEHVKMGRKSAIKVMAPAMAGDPDAIGRFNREAANASRISHPNVCQIYDFGETPDGIIYLAMEFIEGQALTDVIEGAGALEPARAGRILEQAASALQAAHDLSIVHRDLKPDNIMIVQGRDGSDIVKVVDFGIAKAVAGDETGQKVTKTGLVVGTPEYMSPEQLSGDKLDGRSDIYSLGLVLYRMLTGVLPFQADSAQETMIKRLTDDPTPLAVARPDIVFPATMQAVLDRALTRLPSERYQSAAEFGRDTAQAVEGLAAAAPQTRVDVAHGAATQLMDTDAAVKAVTKHIQKKGAAAAAAAAPPEPARKFPLVPVLGGVGAVAALAVVGVVAMGKLNRGPSTAAAADTTHTSQAGSQVAANAPRSANTANPTRNERNNPPPRADTAKGANPPPRADTTRGNPPAAAANWADTLKAANDAFDAERNAEARRLASSVFAAPGATGGLKARAAVLVATTYGQEGNTERAIDWYRNALRYDPGNERIRNAITQLGGTP